MTDKFLFVSFCIVYMIFYGKVFRSTKKQRQFHLCFIFIVYYLCFFEEFTSFCFKFNCLITKSACFYVLRYLEIQKYVDIEMETIIMSFISLLFEQIHIVIHFLMFHDKS